MNESTFALIVILGICISSWFLAVKITDWFDGK